MGGRSGGGLVKVGALRREGVMHTCRVARYHDAPSLLLGGGARLDGVCGLDP